MKKYVPTKLQNFTDKDGDVWIRHSQSGHVVWPKCGWAAFISPDGTLKGYELRQPDRTFARLNSAFTTAATQAIAALWMTVDVPKVFRTKVVGEQRTVRFVKGTTQYTVQLLGKWPMDWSRCRVLNGTVQAHLSNISWCELNIAWSTAVKAAVEHFWGPEMRQDRVPQQVEDEDAVIATMIATGAIEGARNNTCHTLATLMRKRGFSRDEARPKLMKFSYRCRPRMTVAEVKAILTSVYSAEIKQPDGWSFTCTPEKVDIERCLREAYDAGFREAVIEQPRDTTVYFHREVWELLRKSGLAPAAATWVTFRGTDWAPLPPSYAGMLARARAWEAAQSIKPKPESPKPKASKPTVTVKVSGTK